MPADPLQGQAGEQQQEAQQDGKSTAQTQADTDALETEEVLDSQAHEMEAGTGAGIFQRPHDSGVTLQRKPAGSVTKCAAFVLSCKSFIRLLKGLAMSTKAPAAKKIVPKSAVKAAVKVAVKAPVKTAAKPAIKRAAKPAVTVAAVVESKGKRKLVRDSFTMPHADYELIAQLKLRTLKSERSTKKSELLRAGLQALTAMNDKQLLALLDGLSPIKAGRPKSD